MAYRFRGVSRKAPDGNKLAILNALNQGGFISGQVLGEQLSISSAAGSKHMQSLQAMGLDIFKVSGKGYSLNNSVGLLEQNKIQQYSRLERQYGTYRSASDH